jgi:hypothetical protein
LKLKLLQENIYIIVFAVIFIIKSIIDVSIHFKNKVKEKKDRDLKNEGIAPLAENVQEKKEKKIKEQLEYMKNDGEDVFKEILKVYSKELKLKKFSTQWFFLERILNRLKTEYILLMTKYIHENNFLSYTAEGWIKYKEKRIKTLYYKTNELCEDLWKKDNVGCTFEEAGKKLDKFTVQYVGDTLNFLFDNLKEISETLETEIKEKKILLGKILE